MTILLQKLNSNVHNLWPGEGYENSLINTYQYMFREWAVEAAAEADPGKWAKAKARELAGRVKGKKKKAATFQRVVGNYALMLHKWAPAEGSKLTPQEQLSKFLIESADTFEVDLPYTPNRKSTFVVRNDVVATMLETAALLLPWSEGGASGVQSISGLVGALEGALFNFRFPTPEAQAAAVPDTTGSGSSGAAKPGPGAPPKAATAMVLTDSTGKDMKTMGGTKAPAAAPTASIAARAAQLFRHEPLRDWTTVPNAGNTCYIASVLNLILATPGYRTSLMNNPRIAHLDAQHVQLARATEYVLQTLTGDRLSVDDVERYRQTLIATGWQNHDRDRAGGQQDAAELLDFILDRVGSTPGVGVQHQYTDRASAAVHAPAAAPDRMLRLQGLSHGGGGGRTIEQLLGLNFNRSIAEYNGGAIRDHVYSIAALPRTLTIQLGRFNYSTHLGAAMKLHEKITVGERLTIPAALSPTHADTAYALNGFVVHMGNSPRGGHYVAYELVGGVEWIRTDDGAASVVTRDEALAVVKEAYLISYTRAD